MSLAPEATETSYALVGANLGPFATVWTCGDPSEVYCTLNLGPDGGVLTPGGVDFTAVGATPLVTGCEVTLQAHLIPGGVAWPANSSVCLRRVTANGQPSTFGEAIGFSPAASESALDVIARQVQETEQRMSRTVRAQPGETMNPLPNVAARKGTIPWFETVNGFVTAGTLQYLSQPEAAPGDAYLRVADDGLTMLGSPGHRWAVLYAVTGAINISDANLKQDVAPIPDAVLDAWADVGLVQFRLISEAERHGEAAKLHVGVIAQAVVAAFARRGLSAFHYGVVELELIDHGEGAEPTRQLGVRYDQAMVLEAAVMRRELQRLRKK